MSGLLTIVSWNVNGARSSRTWGPIEEHLSELGADVALLQEAQPDWFDGINAVFRPEGIAGRDRRNRPWGSAVVALTERVSLRPVSHAQGVWHGNKLGESSIACVDSGHVAIARANTPAGAMTLISAYGVMEFGYATGALLRTLADLEPLLDDPTLGDNVVLAGDWNIGTWWSGEDRRYAVRDGATLALVSAMGFVDCLDAHVPPDRGRLTNCRCDLGDQCRHVWTFRKDSREIGYQDDYVFATAELATRFAEVGVPENWSWGSDLSDHAPLVATISLGG